MNDFESFSWPTLAPWPASFTSEKNCKKLPNSPSKHVLTLLLDLEYVDGISRI